MTVDLMIAECGQKLMKLFEQLVGLIKKIVFFISNDMIQDEQATSVIETILSV